MCSCCCPQQAMLGTTCVCLLFCRAALSGNGRHMQTLCMLDKIFMCALKSKMLWVQVKALQTDAALGGSQHSTSSARNGHAETCAHCNQDHAQDTQLVLCDNLYSGTPDIDARFMQADVALFFKSAQGIGLPADVVARAAERFHAHQSGR